MGRGSYKPTHAVVGAGLPHSLASRAISKAGPQPRTPAFLWALAHCPPSPSGLSSLSQAPFIPLSPLTSHMLLPLPGCLPHPPTFSRSQWRPCLLQEALLGLSRQARHLLFTLMDGTDTSLRGKLLCYSPGPPKCGDISITTPLLVPRVQPGPLHPREHLPHLSGPTADSSHSGSLAWLGAAEEPRQ